MSEYYFTFRSLTQGQTAYHILYSHGFRALLIRAPRALSQLGCGYALQLVTQSPSEALMRLMDGHAAPAGIFRKNPLSGQPEAVQL